MANISIFSNRFNGSMFLVSNVGEVSSFGFSFDSVDYARSECRDWLRKRPDLCFVSVVVGGVLVAMAGDFPWRIAGVSLAPLAC